VYDASARGDNGKGASLNDCLHVGPSLNPLLFDILVRFRQKRIALIADIEKAFLNVEVDKIDRDCLRFLWLKNAQDANSDIEVYRFCRVVFGLKSSPFLLNATLRYHFSKYKDIDPAFVETMLESFYVDDLVSGGENVAQTHELYLKAKTRLAEGGFQLRKWKTNDDSLRAHIANSENTSNQNDSAADSDLSYAKSTLGCENAAGTEKVLGQAWDTKRDKIKFDFESIIIAAGTKRNVLSVLSRIFDPLGIISPVLVSMKLLFQELCSENYDWDDELHEEKKQKWNDWLDELCKTKSIEIDRCLYKNPNEEILEYQLHGFADASNKAYSAVVYILCRTQNGIHTQLIASKSRVAPLKRLTISRLELMSAKPNNILA
jgi:hypothetical protein